MPTMPGVRRAALGDVTSIVAALVRAFDDDPLSMYLFPNPRTRPRGLRRFFTVQLRRTFIARGEVYTSEGCHAAALWMPPAPQPAGTLEHLAQIPMVTLIGWRLVRLVQLVQAHHPKVPHYYLGTLGTDPAWQGKGLGSAVLQPVLERCDEEAIPAYLESSKERNLAFYHRHGFEVIRELVVPDEDVKLWLMWREPRA